ncbi:hypothetical protein MMC09_000122 [Bachmanniomyces sp. S44760]|nr:hypothetical protein [Bachmanniomyces sp. S44760]
MAPACIPPPLDLSPISSARLKVPQNPVSTAGMPSPNRLRIKRDIVICSDFDSTIVRQDVGRVLFDIYGCGVQRRELLDYQSKTGTRTSKEVLQEKWGSLNVPFATSVSTLENALDVDPGFRSFTQFCTNNDIPFKVISAGLKPLLQEMLDGSLGREEAAKIEIIANDAAINTSGTAWEPVWLHEESATGHDKAQSIRDLRNAAITSFTSSNSSPLVVFIGHAAEDLPAARTADIVFTRKSSPLESLTLVHQIPHSSFETFGDIHRAIIRITQHRPPIAATTPKRLNKAAENPRLKRPNSFSKKLGLESKPQQQQKHKANEIPKLRSPSSIFSPGIIESPPPPPTPTSNIMKKNPTGQKILLRSPFPSDPLTSPFRSQGVLAVPGLTPVRAPARDPSVPIPAAALLSEEERSLAWETAYTALQEVWSPWGPVVESAVV